MKFTKSPFAMSLLVAVAVLSNRSSAADATPVHYRINPAQSHFMVRAYSGGLLWFLGHGHYVAVREFSGEARITPHTLEPATLRMTVQAASLEETGKKFIEQERQIINHTMREQVLEAEKYREMSFNSSKVTTRKTGENEYEVALAGDFTLHGVTRPLTIPARVVVNGSVLHATGEFAVNRSDYKVKTHSVKAGTIRVRNRVKFLFDINANKT